MVRGLEDNLRFEGYQTLSATDGRRGLALALSEAPDLLLLDIMMPGMSGWDVCRELRAKGLGHSRHHADRPAARKPIASRGWSWAPTTT
jgi:DNA-binding response OmpR family regulator